MNNNQGYFQSQRQRNKTLTSDNLEVTADKLCSTWQPGVTVVVPRFRYPTYILCQSNTSKDLQVESGKVEFFTIGVSVRLSDWSLHRAEQKNFTKNCLQWGLKPGPLDLQANALPTELSQHSVASLNLHGFYKVMLNWFKKWTKSNMWSGAWNKQSPLQKSPAQQIPA